MCARHLLALMLFAALTASSAHAWQDAGNDEYFIEADSWNADRQSGVAVYRGNVRISHGSFEILGDELRLRFEDEEFADATIVGSPVRFVQRHNDDRPPTEAESREVIYHAHDGIVRLRGGARVVQAGDEFASDDIRYDTRAERVVAGGEPGARVQVTIQPRRQPENDRPEPR